MKLVRKFSRKIKRSLYFFVASYFSFWAKIYLNRWQPLIITVTGSSGKTTLLHLFEAQLGTTATYSHKANSTFGIPFHILGLERHSFSLSEWLSFFIQAPFRAYRKIHSEKIYVTEADAERPGEAQSIAKLLNPDIVVWLSLEEAHGINFDTLVHSSNDDTRTELKQAMAKEFGYLLQYAKKFVVLNSDNEFIKNQAYRTQAEVLFVSEDDIKNFVVNTTGITLQATVGDFEINQLIPKSAGLSIISVIKVIKKLDFKIDHQFRNFKLPPSRSSVFPGIKNTTIIDSSYNATFDGMRAMLDLMNRYPAHGEKWLVLGDMIEQGKNEAFEHIDLAHMILEIKPDRVILVGPRLREFTFAKLLLNLDQKKVVSYLMPAEALEYLQKELKGNETILFKGARFLEGIVERLLERQDDRDKLCRREEIWIKKRKQWGI